MRIAIVGATGLVGSALVRAPQAAGHDVIALSKRSGVDVLQPEGLADLLRGAEAVVDVTQSPSLDEDEATRFFARAAENLGRAGTAAGVQWSVVLSIIGVDQIAAARTDAGTGYDGYYRAKYATRRPRGTTRRVRAWSGRLSSTTSLGKPSAGAATATGQRCRTW